RTDIFLIPFPRTRCRGRRRRREPYSNPIRAEIRLPPPCEGRHARSCAPPSIGRPPYRRRRVSRFPHSTSSSILLGVTANHRLGAVTVLHIYDLLPPRNLPRMSRASLYSERSEVRSNFGGLHEVVSTSPRRRTPQLIPNLQRMLPRFEED